MRILPALAVMLGASPALACNANMMNFAAHDLRRLADASTLSDAQHAARRARRSVEDAEFDLMSCCPNVSFLLNDAVRNLRRVENAMSGSEASDERRRAFRNFNDAVQSWNMRSC